MTTDSKMTGRETRRGATAPMSLEITTRNRLPADAAYREIFITWLPTEPKEPVIAKVAELHAQGFAPVPHISAFKVRDAAEARTLAAQLAPYTRKVFLIRGGGRQEGAFATVADLLATGAFAGFEIGIAGFPEGNGPLSYEESLAILRAKAPAAQFVTTQWSLDAAAVRRFLDDSPLPVHVGIPNRCTTAQLIRFAAICGVENTVRGALANPRNLLRFVTGFDPRYLVDALAGHPRLAKFHVYAFGNFAKL